MVSIFALVVGASHDHGCATMCGVDAPDIAMQGFLVLKEIVLVVVIIVLYLGTHK